MPDAAQRETAIRRSNARDRKAGAGHAPETADSFDEVHPMSGLAECRSLNCSGSRCLSKSAPAWGSDLAAARMATADHLMARGSGLTIPRLDGVPREHQMWQGEQAAARTAAAFLKAGLVSADDWYRAQRNPFDFVKMTLNHWVAAHWAAEIQEEFRLHLTLSTSLDRYFTDQEPSTTSELYLPLEPESAGYVVLGPTLRMPARAP